MITIKSAIYKNQVQRDLISAAPDYIFLYKLFMWGVMGAPLNCGFEGTNPLLAKTNATKIRIVIVIKITLHLQTRNFVV